MNQASKLASYKMSRSPRLADKAPVMQAMRILTTGLIEQKQKMKAKVLE